VTDVSVLTPSFQYGRFLRDALASVAAQTGVSVEHVVQDGGSTDETLSILEQAGPGVSWRSEPDCSHGEALNRALRRAGGRWIAWLNVDEFYLPGALETLVRTVESTGADAAYGDCAFVDEEGRLLRLVAQHRFDPSTLRRYGCYIQSCTFIVRRDLLGEDPWDVTIRGIVDHALYLKLTSEGVRFAYVPRALGAYRVHPAQDSLQEVGNPERNRRLGLREKYDLPDPFPGRGARTRHRLLKLQSGAYLREFRWLRRRGQSVRWFAEG